MVKKAMCSVMAMAFAVALCPALALAGTSGEIPGETWKDNQYTLTYTIGDDGNVTITGYKGSPDYVSIPDTIEGKDVTAIGNGAFEGCTSLRDVADFPSSMKYIGSRAFANCPKLTSVIISDKDAYVAPDAFDKNVVVTIGRWGRVYGDTRYDTMLLSTTSDNESCTEIVLASGENFPDGLTATSLVGALDSKLVLTNPYSLSPQAATAIEGIADGDAKVYILGGDSAISKNVEQQVANLSCVSSVERLSGNLRTDTAVSIYNAGKGNWSSTAIIVNAYQYPDALSVGAYAAKTKAPIFGTDQSGLLTTDEADAIKAGGFSKVLVIGGPAVVNYDGVKAQLGDGYSYTRLYGNSRYSTSAQILMWSCGGTVEDATFDPDFTFIPFVIAASGDNFPDGLSAVNVAKVGAPILLVGNYPDSYDNINTIIPGVYGGFVMGGQAAVPDYMLTLLRNAMPQS